MNRTGILHPQLLAALARTGHGGQVLVADANYPASTARPPGAEVVHLNLVPGIVDAVTVATAVCATVPVEQARVMAPLTSGPYAMDHEPPVWQEFAAVLRDSGNDLALETLERTAFYAEASGPDVSLVVVSGELRLYANLLLRVGVVKPA